VSGQGELLKSCGEEIVSDEKQTSNCEGGVVSNSEPPSDMDAMTPLETKALESFQSKLGQEDKVIGKLILSKKVDKGQLDYMEKTNAMLHRENQKLIDNVFDKYKNEESNFIRKNPYVVDKPKLLENIKNTTYKDVAATKRGFLATNDNARVENVYNSLLKEDEMISKGLNEKAEVKKAFLRHKDNPEDEQVSNFLDFLEKEDSKAENGDNYADVKPKKKTTKRKARQKSKMRLLVVEPSLEMLSDKFAADGTPQLTEKDLAHILKDGVRKPKKVNKLKALMKKTADKKSKSKYDMAKQRREREKQVQSKEEGNSIRHESFSKTGKKDDSSKKDSANKGSLLHDSKNRPFTQMKVIEILGGIGSHKNPEKSSSDTGKEEGNRKRKENTQKNNRILQDEKLNGNKREDAQKEKNDHRTWRTSKTRASTHKSSKRLHRFDNFQKFSKMKEGDMKSSLSFDGKTEKDEQKGKDKEYVWHGTVKPETRQLPTNPTEQIRKFGRISNLVPVSFEPASPEGIGEIIGDSNNIASLGTATKETTGFGDLNTERDASKAYETNGKNFRKPILNKINENDISSTSFFSASKPRQNQYNQILNHGIDPAAQKLASSAMKEINDKEAEKITGMVDKDTSNVVSLFDPNTMRPKLEEFIDRENEGVGENSDEKSNSHEYNLHKGQKKHKVKIVLHLPEQIEGNIQEIHGKDSEMPIGTIKDLTMQYNKNEQKPSLQQELADDDEDTLETILSKPTAKLEQFQPQSTLPSIEYVPETVEGKESKEWEAKEDDEDRQEPDNKLARERNDDDDMDNVKSNKLLSMIKHSEDLLQKELGKHDNSEEKVEGFVSKAKNDDKQENELVDYDESGGKSVKSKDKVQLSNKKRKKKKKVKKLELFNYEAEPSTSPNIYADQINYEQKSKEVSQQVPTDTVNEIHQILNADQNLIPLTFQSEDKNVPNIPGIKPLGGSQMKKLVKASGNIGPQSTAAVLMVSKNHQKLPSITNWKVSPFLSSDTAPHSLHIEGGKIHGGTINGGFISGGDIEGGDIEGGIITGGKILGGVFKDGRMDDGVLRNGTIEGGFIKGGSIYGGKIRAGLVAGGKLTGGEVIGGRLTGGEIDGGVLKAGEVQGGLLKSGSVEGGLLKGGTIEGGHLIGGVMLGGKLKGGVVKSGVIKGGTIEGGVVDGGIIEDGVVIKGGVVRGPSPINSTVVFERTRINKTVDEDELSEHKFEEDLLSFSTTPSEKVVLSKPTTAQMYKLKVDTALQDHFVEPDQQDSSAKVQDQPVTKPSNSQEPISISTLGAPESWPVQNKDKGGKQTDSNKQEEASVSYSNAEGQKQNLSVEKPTTYQGSNNNKIKPVPKLAGKTKNPETKEFEQLAKDAENADQKSLMMRSPTPISKMKDTVYSFFKNYGTTTRATIDPRPATAKYHWSLNSVRGGKIAGSPGKSMSVIGGIKVHGGVATLNDGLDRGYIDAGDFQGECISDPDVCKKGLTLSLTSKIYKDSTESPTRMYLFDSGAGNEDSKGMALWVNRGKIEGAVSTHKGTWCLGEDLDKFKDRWVDYVLTWHPMRGLYLYANCELLAVSGFGRGCDVCTRSDCHQYDKNTHLMFGRPNKGPHFKLTHFSAGDITIYEDFFATDRVTQLCGSNNDFLKGSNIAPKRLTSNVPSKSALDASSYVMKKQQLTSKTPEFVLPPANNVKSTDDSEFEVWPTPSGLHFLSALFNTPPASKPIQREIVKVDGGYSDWSSWTSCIGVCGGTSMATRYCNDPVPKHGGHDCSSLGPARRTRQCDESNCLDLKNIKAIARLEQSESTDIENDISKRKHISRAKVSSIDQQEDIKDLKEELSIMKHK